MLAHDPDQLQFVLDIRSAERDRGELWVVSTRLQKFLRKTVSPHEVNLRIMRVVGVPAPVAHPAPHAALAPVAPVAPVSPPHPAPYGNYLHY